MANYQSTHTGAQIDAGIDLLDKNSATSGQVLTANGTGGASWQNASGGSTVEANPTLAGTEADLTGLSVNGTKYKVPSGGSGSGTVVANPSTNATEELSTIRIDGTTYSIGTGMVPIVAKITQTGSPFTLTKVGNIPISDSSGLSGYDCCMFLHCNLSLLSSFSITSNVKLYAHVYYPDGYLKKVTIDGDNVEHVVATSAGEIFSAIIYTDEFSGLSNIKLNFVAD